MFITWPPRYMFAMPVAGELLLRACDFGFLDRMYGRASPAPVPQGLVMNQLEEVGICVFIRGIPLFCKSKFSLFVLIQ